MDTSLELEWAPGGPCEAGTNPLIAGWHWDPGNPREGAGAQVTTLGTQAVAIYENGPEVSQYFNNY